MLRDIVSGLQEIILQGPPNEIHKDMPCMEKLEDSEVMNQFFTDVMDTMTYQQQLAVELLQMRSDIQAIQITISNIQ